MRNNANAMLMNVVLVPREFAVRNYELWKEGPSLIFILDGREHRKPLREMFDIHWEDIDIRMHDVNECLRDESAIDSRPRRSLNVKVIHNMTVVPEGINVRLTIASMHDGRNQPYYQMQDLDADGQPKLDDKKRPKLVPAKLVFERVFPRELIQPLCDIANAFERSMESYRLARWAMEKGDSKTFTEMGRSLDHFRDVLSGAYDNDQTVTIGDGEIAKKKEGEKKKGGNKKAKRAEAAAVSTETTDAPAAAPVDEQIAPPEGSVPNVDAMPDLVPVTPAPAATATKPSKKKQEEPSPAPVKLTLKDIQSLGVPVAGTSDGSNGQQ